MMGKIHPASVFEQPEVAAVLDVGEGDVRKPEVVMEVEDGQAR